ncbi:hypothetical protein [Paenibacillus alvei]|uniref:hypothetical protein n=1 Tax=Paenibacillus alvei TaxID=44250 RepID=UPI002281FEA1|nr:hypothetical protein [Paenibacillus alvei]MCY9577876.1 hypothetical protein [Paenibacillus alvei]
MIIKLYSGFGLPRGSSRVVKETAIFTLNKFEIVMIVMMATTHIHIGTEGNKGTK